MASTYVRRRKRALCERALPPWRRRVVAASSANGSSDNCRELSRCGVEPGAGRPAEWARSCGATVHSGRHNMGRGGGYVRGKV